ncbi:MAG: hypothetical protein PF447_13770 [Spirochaetaceae bacterium]|nr:hypothetical protein [Spirochaetaceae bacterium]
MKRLFLLILLLISLSLSAQDARRIALLNLDNVNGDPQYDYLEGMIRGVLLFDLGSQSDIQLVVRSELNGILAEQQLALSGLVQDEAIELGQLLSADYLISGEYIFLGDETMVNLSLIDVKTGVSSAYRARGSLENFIHGLAEELILDITGREISLQGSDGERSIISLRDETPGSLAFFTILQQAEIYIDGNFVGYSTGNRQDPFIMEDLSPGPHSIALHLSGFGVVNKPEYTFHQYEEEFTIESGKKLTLRPEIHSANHFISEDKTLFSEWWRYSQLETNETVELNVPIEFTNRSGEEQRGLLSGTFFNGEPGKNLDLVLNYNDVNYPLVMHNSENSYKKVEESFGDIDVILEYSNTRISIKVNRNDIWAGMFNQN